MSLPGEITVSPLILNWRGQKLGLKRSSGIFAINNDGVMHEFSPSEFVDTLDFWPFIFGFERGDGWVSVRCFESLGTPLINGHIVLGKPILFKEQSMLKLVNDDSGCEGAIHLFLCESLDEWQSVGDKNGCELKSTPNGNRYVPQLSEESVTALKLNRALNDCSTLYGLVSDGELNHLHGCYRYGAVRFEVEDDECWVFADEGRLQVNDVDCSAVHIVVGDRVTWQKKTWFVVGQSKVKRSCHLSQFKKQDDPLPTDDLFFEEARKSLPSDAVLQHEMDQFRTRIREWISLDGGLDPGEGYMSESERSGGSILSVSSRQSQSNLGLRQSREHTISALEAAFGSPRLESQPRPRRRALFFAGVAFLSALCGLVFGLYLA